MGEKNQQIINKPKKDEEKKKEGLKENISSVFQTSSRILTHRKFHNLVL